MKENKDDTNRWGNITMFVDWKTQYSEMSILPKAIYRFSTIPISGICHRARTNNFTICMETQKTLNSHSNLEKE